MTSTTGGSYFPEDRADTRTPGPYERNERWLGFFGTVADAIVRTLQPHSVLDVGCGAGLLVETLRARGVDARGIEIADDAISGAHDTLADYLSVAPLSEPLGTAVDLVTCIDTLERIPPAELRDAVKNLTAVTDAILLSPVPDDDGAWSDLNVEPPDYWAGLFAEHGFIRDVDFDATFLFPGAMLLRRSDQSLPAVVQAFERERSSLLRHEEALRTSIVDEQTTTPEREVIQDLRNRLRDAIDEARGADARRATLEGRLRETQNALEAALAREAEIEAFVHRDGDPARIHAILRARTFRIYWAVYSTYRRLRAKLR